MFLSPKLNLKVFARNMMIFISLLWWTPEHFLQISQGCNSIYLKIVQLKVYKWSLKFMYTIKDYWRTIINGYLKFDIRQHILLFSKILGLLPITNSSLHLHENIWNQNISVWIKQTMSSLQNNHISCIITYELWRFSSYHQET